MKAQLKSLQATHVNNVVAQSNVQQSQQTTVHTSIQNITNFSKRETELGNEVKNLKQDLQIKNNQLVSVQNNHKNILDLFNKTSEEVVSLKSQNKELKTVIEKQKADLLSVSEQKQNIESSFVDQSVIQQLKQIAQQLQSENQSIATQNDIFFQRSKEDKEQIAKLNKVVSSLRFSIKVINVKSEQLEKSQEEQIAKLIKANSLLMQIIQDKDKEIELIKNQSSNSQAMPYEVSSIDAEEQKSSQNDLNDSEAEQFNFSNLEEAKSILIENSNPNISQQQIDVSYGEPILNQHGQPILGGVQPQLMGDSSQDFSIIDHQD